jgi:chromosome partitioning protein
MYIKPDDSPSQTYSILDARIYADFIYLDTFERKFFAKNKHEYLIEQLQFDSDTNYIGGQQFLKRALTTLKDEYDVILIDCQPTMGQLTVNALVASHEVIVPLQCEYFALHGFIELSGNIEKVKNFLNPELRLIGILATMYDRKTLHNREVLSAILEKYPNDVFDTIIAKTIRFSETTVVGEPITSYASSSGGAASYRRLARELIARGGAR